ncbi:hypothetical protein HanOQP8_Chr00c445g0831221 [Helianthus annuus]|nr:hypothetical protein HanOQP8_Chr00c445g0831221 [Helianthus annuus]
MMMNNLWMYDFNMLEESQNNLFSWFPVQESPEYAISDPALSSSSFLLDTEHNRENDDPNTIKVAEVVESKVTQKSVKGPRSKRCKRTVFKSPSNFTSTPSVELHGSVDNQGSAMSKRSWVELISVSPFSRNKGVRILKIMSEREIRSRGEEILQKYPCV